MNKPAILIALQDQDIIDQVSTITLLENFDIHLSPKNQPWVDMINEHNIRIVMADCDLFSKAEYDHLIDSKTLHNLEFIFFSHGGINEYVDKITAMGACFRFRIPFVTEVLTGLLSDLLTEFSKPTEVKPKPLTSDLDQFGLLVGSSQPMYQLYRVIRKAAKSSAKVMIIGESGVGKELIANTIHMTSSRSDEPFIAVNCGALSPELIESELFGHVKGAFTGAQSDRAGVFEKAKGGTLFLDEVTEMPLELQVKFLRVLETKEFKPVGSDKIKVADVQLISATNRNPNEAIQDGHLRTDLYFRLAQFPIHATPLRERGTDITGLAKHFLIYRNDEENTAKRISDSALLKIEQHKWPGNVRELKHTIERAYLLADKIIEPEHILTEDLVEPPEHHEPEVPAGVPLEEIEQQAIQNTLEQNDGKKSDTAKQLGISVKTLYNKLDKYNVTED